jgi:hypothetical protein
MRAGIGRRRQVRRRKTAGDQSLERPAAVSSVRDAGKHPVLPACRAEAQSAKAGRYTSGVLQRRPVIASLRPGAGDLPPTCFRDRRLGWPI